MNKKHLLNFALFALLIGGGMFVYKGYCHPCQQKDTQKTNSNLKPIYKYKSELISEAEMIKSLHSCEVPSMNVLSQRLDVFIKNMRERNISTESLSGVIVEVPPSVLTFPEGTRIPKKCEVAGIVWYTPAASNLNSRTWRQLGFSKPFSAYDSVEFEIRFPPGFRDPTRWTNEDYQKMREATDIAEQEYLAKNKGIIPVEDLASGPSSPELSGTISIRLQPVEIYDWNNYGVNDANVIKIEEQYYIVRYEKYAPK